MSAREGEEDRRSFCQKRGKNISTRKASVMVGKADQDEELSFKFEGRKLTRLSV